MRIRPIFVTLLTSALSIAALAAVVSTTEPENAQASIRALLWAALVLSVWGVATTLLLGVRFSLAQASGGGLAIMLGAVSALLSAQYGFTDRRLMIGIILATLGLLIYFWWRFMPLKPHD